MQDKQLPLRTVLLDLDGTLANSIGSLKQVYYDFLSGQGKMGSEGEFEELNGPSIKEIVATLAAKHKLQGTIETHTDNYMSLLDQAYQTSVAAVEGSRDLLEYLHGQQLQIGLVTSAPESLAIAFLAANEWTRFFDLIVSGEQVKHAKPEPDIYQHALERMNAIAATTVAVEDSLNGIRAALGAELRVIAIRTGSMPPELTSSRVMVARDLAEALLRIRSLTEAGQPN